MLLAPSAGKLGNNTNVHVHHNASVTNVTAYSVVLKQINVTKLAMVQHTAPRLLINIKD